MPDTPSSRIATRASRCPATALIFPISPYISLSPGSEAPAGAASTTVPAAAVATKVRLLMCTIAADPNNPLLQSGEHDVIAAPDRSAPVTPALVEPLGRRTPARSGDDDFTDCHGGLTLEQ